MEILSSFLVDIYKKVLFVVLNVKMQISQNLKKHVLLNTFEENLNFKKSFLFLD